MKVTIKDLAKELNLSASTVSRALKNDARISEPVRISVQALAKERGYRPNLLARSLVNEKSHEIGVVINDITWPIFSELSHHIQNAAEKFGYTVILYSSNNDPVKERIGIERMIARQSDGLIVFANEDEGNLHFLESLFAERTPVVLLNGLTEVELDVVSIDYRSGVLQLLDHLVKSGYQKIAYVGPVPQTSAERERFSAYQQFMDGKYALQVVTGEAYPLLGYDLVKQLIKDNEVPSAIMAYNDIIAMGAVRALLESGLRVPEDVSVVGFDGLAFASFIFPPLTTASIPIQELAEIAVKLIVERIESGEKQQKFGAPKRCKVVPKLIVRDSVGNL